MKAPLQRIDAGVAWPLHGLLKFLCGATGKSNFFFARVVLGLSVVVMMARASAILLANPSLSGRFNFFWSTALIFVITLGYNACIFTLEQVVLRQPDSSPYPMTLPVWRILQRWRCLLVVITTVELFMGPRTFDDHLLAAWFGLLAVICYFAADVQSPRRSWAKQALDRIRSLQLSKPILAPSPLGA